MELTFKHIVLKNGAISPTHIANIIEMHNGGPSNIGGYNIFIGQVRSDKIEGKKVVAIEYSAYEEMAEQKIDEIILAALDKYNLNCIHINHSLGLVKAGEICLFVLVTSKHRKDVFDACREIVEQIKEQVPIWGKEIFEDNSYAWKENK